MQLSGSLLAVFSQTLCKSAQPSNNGAFGRVMAQEIMINTPAVANLIREGKTAQLYSQIQTGANQGMQTLERALANLVHGREGEPRGSDAENHQAGRARAAARPMMDLRLRQADAAPVPPGTSDDRLRRHLHHQIRPAPADDPGCGQPLRRQERAAPAGHPGQHDGPQGGAQDPAGRRQGHPASSLGALSDLLEGPVTIRDKALFANKLSALVDAGVPILRSLDLMRIQQRSTKMQQALAGMTQDVNQGGSLGDAMRRWPKVFDNLSIAMVEAGEAGGVLDETLKRLAKLLEDNAKLQNQIKGAMGYPVTVLVIAIAVFLGMTIFLIPTFASVFEQLGAELPLFTQLMLNLSEFLRSWKALVLLGVLVGFAYWVVATYNTPIGRRQIDGLMLKLPLFGELLQKTATAQFCRTMSSLSKAGVPILLCLEIVRETSTNSVIGDAIISSKNEVSEGMPLSVALRMKNVFPGDVREHARDRRGNR